MPPIPASPIITRNARQVFTDIIKSLPALNIGSNYHLIIYITPHRANISHQIDIAIQVHLIKIILFINRSLLSLHLTHILDLIRPCYLLQLLQLSFILCTL